MNTELLTHSQARIIRYIAEKQLPVGARLPSIRQLQALFLISKSTAMQALKGLCEDGTIEKGSSTRDGYRIRRLPENHESSEAAQNLAAQYILPFNSWNFVGNQLLTQVGQIFSANSCSLLFSNNCNSVDTEHSLLLNLVMSTSFKPDVLLLMPSNSLSNPNIELLRMIQQRTPVVLIDRTVSGFDSFYIGLNNRAVGQKSAEMLLEKGYRDLAYVGGGSILSPIQERLEGFLSVLRSRDVAIADSRILLFTGLDFGGYHQIRQQVNQIGARLLQLDPRPSAVVCGTDRIAACLINYFLSEGLSVPRDIAVIGCNGDTDFSDLCQVPLCSFGHPFHEMAQTIYQTAKDLKANPSITPRRIEFMPSTINGKSI